MTTTRAKLDDGKWNPPTDISDRLTWGIHSTDDCLNHLIKKFNLPSDYALARVLGVEKGTIYRYRKHEGSFSEEVAIKVADLLEVDHAFVLAIAAYDRSGNAQARAAWLKIAQRIGITTLAVFFAIPLLDYTTGSNATAAADSVYYVKSIIALWIAFYLFSAAVAFDSPNNNNHGSLQHDVR
jgi:hypothetical protein